MQADDTFNQQNPDELTGEPEELETFETDPVDLANPDLANLDEDFGETPVQEDSYDTVPDGKYQVRVAKVGFARSRKTRSLMLKWQLKILGPTHAGRYLFRNNMVCKESLSWLKTDLHRCGLDLAKASDLPGRMGELMDLTLEVTKKTKGENENVYINRRIEVAAPVEELAPF